MSHYVDTPATIAILGAAVDAQMGLPKLGVDADGNPVEPAPGQPIASAVGATIRYADAILHPTNGLAAYPSNSAVTATLATILAMPGHPTALDSLAAPIALDASWFPVPVRS